MSAPTGRVMAFVALIGGLLDRLKEWAANAWRLARGRPKMVGTTAGAVRYKCPPLVAFLDERVIDLPERRRVIAGFCLLNRDRWGRLHREERAVRRLRGKRRLDGFENLVDRAGGVGLIGYADIPRDLLSDDGDDSTPDIPRMSRGDNVWGLVILTTVMAAMGRLQASGIPVGHLDVYYDRKDLTREHRVVIEDVRRRILPETAREAAAERPEFFSGDVSGLRIAAIEQVQKPSRAETPHSRQSGVSLVDELCRQLDVLVLRGNTDHLLAVDQSPYVLGALSGFLGNSTHGARQSLTALRTAPAIRQHLRFSS